MMDENRQIDWWVKFIDANTLEREDMIKNLPARKEMIKMIKTLKEEELLEHTTTLLFLSLFEDCIETCYEMFKEAKK